VSTTLDKKDDKLPSDLTAAEHRYTLSLNGVACNVTRENVELWLGRAAQPVAADDINAVVDLAHSVHLPQRFLQELLQIEGWQAAGEDQRIVAALDANRVCSAAEVWVRIECLRSISFNVYPRVIALG
jgi:hypothetical protein